MTVKSKKKNEVRNDTTMKTQKERNKIKIQRSKIKEYK